jgi:DNA-binding NtrC family response regulator
MSLRFKSPASGFSPGPPAGENYEGNRILVVRDQAGMRRALRRALKAFGYDVSEARDGVEALKALESKPFDLVISDIKILKLSGISLLKAVKNSSKNISVIL